MFRVEISGACIGPYNCKYEDGFCVDMCAPNAFSYSGNTLTISQDECVGCTACCAMCPAQAITIYNIP